MDRTSLIVKLIAQDIKHNQLTNGLEEIGLSDNENYTLDIVSVVLSLMDKQPTDNLLETYHSTMLGINHNLTPKEIKREAQTLFDKLRRKIKKGCQRRAVLEFSRIAKSLHFGNTLK